MMKEKTRKEEKERVLLLRESGWFGYESMTWDLTRWEDEMGLRLGDYSTLPLFASNFGRNQRIGQVGRA